MTESVPAREVATSDREVDAARKPERGSNGGGIGIPIPGLATPPAGPIRRSGADAGESHGAFYKAGAWVVDKVKEKVLGEGKPDEDVKKAMENIATVYSTASGAIEGFDPDARRRREAYKELGEKFEAGAKSGEKLIKTKEYAELSIEFVKAVEEAKAADPTTPEGTRALLKVMNVGGKLGKKVFPPPLNVEFDFLADPKFMDLANVKDALDPTSMKNSEGRQMRQVDGMSDFFPGEPKQAE